jgi:protein-S-isoprenylcysteine O-methyltransferase Ste14
MPKTAVEEPVRWRWALLALVPLSVVAAVLFGAAGRWDLPFFWAYLGIFSATVLHMVLTADPDLIRERLRPGPGGRDNLALLRLLGLLFFGGHWVLAGLDVGRYHWSDTVPAAVQAVALAAMAAAVAVTRWAQTENRFFSAAMRIQRDRGHHVITTGPYGYVRHPGYAAFILAGISSGLALGSWLAALLGTLFVGAFVRRAQREDRMLRDELEGYEEYAAKVRYRLVPGVW